MSMEHSSLTTNWDRDVIFFSFGGFFATTNLVNWVFCYVFKGGSVSTETCLCFSIEVTKVTFLWRENSEETA